MHDLSIPTVVDGEDAVITQMFDATGTMVSDARAAVAAVGVYLTGRLAGWWFVLCPFDPVHHGIATVH